MGALRDRMTSHMELRGLSPRTIDVYLRQMTCCWRCHRLLYDKQRFNTRPERRGLALGAKTGSSSALPWRSPPDVYAMRGSQILTTDRKGHEAPQALKETARGRPLAVNCSITCQPA